MLFCTVSFFKRAVSLDPQNTELYLNYAEALAEYGNKDKAGDLYNKVLETEPENVYALFFSGVLLWKAGRIDEATERFNRASEEDSTSPEINYYTGLCRLASGNFDSALKHAEKALKFMLTRDYYLLKAEALTGLDREADALMQFDAGEKLFSGDVPAG